MLQHSKVRSDIPEDKVLCLIAALSHSMTQSDNYAVVLGEEGKDYRLPIVIGSAEAQSIAVAMEQMIPVRPLTHDLLASVVKATGCQLDSVLIDELKEGLFFAKLCLTDGQTTAELDCQCADAIALALRLEAPIFVNKSVMEDAGVEIQLGSEDAASPPPSPIEQTGEAPSGLLDWLKTTFGKK